MKKKLLVTRLMQNPSLVLLLQVKILLILLIMMTLGYLQISVQMLLKGVVASMYLLAASFSHSRILLLSLAADTSSSSLAQSSTVS